MRRVRPEGTGGLLAPVLRIAPLARPLAIRFYLLLALGTWANPTVGSADNQALVAVATNFAATASRLRDAFAVHSDLHIRLTNGSTGKLYAQIRHGAPYDVFLAADSARPAQLEQDGLALPGSRRTYALGTLVLWSADANGVAANGIATLRHSAFRRLAMANPELAPYGAAAQQTLQRLNLFEPLNGKIVRGENIGQTYAMVASGNAELGFVARSSLIGSLAGSRWPVPAHCHEPIVQQAVLLQRGRKNPAATAFFKFLASDTALAIIRADGYRTAARTPSKPHVGY